MHKIGLVVMATVAMTTVGAAATPAAAAPQRVIYTDGTVAAFGWIIPAKGHVELTLKSCEDLTWRHQANNGTISARHQLPHKYLCSRNGVIKVTVGKSSFNATVVHRGAPKGAL